MALVKDDQTESVTELLHVDTGAVVGRNRYRPEVVGIVADNPGVVTQSG